MVVPGKPNDIARETLRLLISHGEAPTPENYRRRYCDIAGDAVGRPSHVADWARMLRDLLRLAREHQFGLAAAEKEAALDKALAAGGDTHTLYNRLGALATAWARMPIAIGVPDAVKRPEMDADAGDAQPASAELREFLAHMLEVSIATCLIDSPELAADASVLAHRLRMPAPIDTSQLSAQLKAIGSEIELSGKRRDAVQGGLLRLLRLLSENVGELVAEDHWLRGQMAMVLELISKPLNPAIIEEAERSLQDVIRQQTLLKESLNATKSTLKDMLASFINELGKLSTATGDYHDAIENLAQQIRQTDDVELLNALLKEVLSETRNIQDSALNSRQEVLRAREKVAAAEARISQLERELETVSEKVREDHLTGTLNRRGLIAAFDREIAIAERQSQVLCVALLDVDNFKEFNDQLGHQAGDDVLVHLAQVMKETMRPSDTVARYGGEEFVLLLPNTELELAVSVIGRLQRELTKRFFLHDHKKLLITFSAGVASHMSGEKQADVIARADQALYEAKVAGKNRVLAATADSIVAPTGSAQAREKPQRVSAAGR